MALDADASSPHTGMLQRRVVFAALMGFLLIGVGAVGCVCFGIVEISSRDAIFLNDGLGEVLTVLGVYFTVPYLFCIGAFVVIVMQPSCLRASSREGSVEVAILFVLTLLAYIIQQIFTDIYLVLLVGNYYVLAIVVFDVAVLAVHLHYKFDQPYGTMLYTVLYATKMAVQWSNAYETAEQAVFGANGVSVMLFLTIPLIQFPLYVMGTSAKTLVVQRSCDAIEGQQQHTDLVTSFTSNFNLFLSHLLHALDICSMYSFAFVPPVSTANQIACPSQLKAMIIILIVISFLGNNISVLHLFYRREDVEEAEIIFLPRKLREVSRSVDTAEEEGGSQRRRIFQYMLFMLVVCDVPMLLTRLELWRQQYSTLNIFVAKNIKSIADAIIMVMRADHTKERSHTAVRSEGRPYSAMHMEQPQSARLFS